MRTSFIKKSIRLAAISLIAFSGQSVAQESMWICAGHRTEIPSGYYVHEIAKNLTLCNFPNQKMLIAKVKSQNFWMCNFQNMGAPAGYVITEESKVQTCGCQTPAKDGAGQVYCFGNKPETMQGWPMVLVRKLSAQ